MPSSFTTRNRLEKQGAGENANTWGTRLNTNVIDLIDTALDGITDFALSSTKTLSDEEGASDEARARVLHITGGTGGTVTIPDLEKVYLVVNDASGPVTLTTGSGVSANVPAGQSQWVVSFGSDVVKSTGAQPYDSDLAAIAALTSAANKVPYATGAGAWAMADFSAFGRSLVDDADAAAARATLGAAASGANTDITALDQDVTITATGTIAANSIGFRGLPASSQSGGSAITLALADAGKSVPNTSGGWVIPANASVAFPVGTTIVLVNNSASSQNISITSDTLRLAGTGTTGTRALAQYGIATIVKVASTTWLISGAGVS